MEFSLKQLNKFLIQSTKGSDNLTLRLFKILKEYYLTPDSTNLLKINVFKKLYGTRVPYEDTKLRLQLSKFTRFLEIFLISKVVNEKSFLFHLELANTFRQLGLEQSYLETLNKGIGEAVKFPEAQRFFILAQCHKSIYLYPKSTMRDRKKCMRISKAYQKKYELLNSLFFCCEELVRLKMYGEKLENGFFDELHHVLLKSEKSDVLLIQFLASAAKLLHKPNLEDYIALKNSFFANYERLDSEQGSILNCLYNIVNIIKDDNRLPKLFELLEFGVKHHYFIEGGIMDATQFSNIVHVACNLKKLKWAENFIQTHLQYLSSNPRDLENTRIVYTAQIDFAKGNYSAVRTNLLAHESNDFTYKFKKYILLFKANYELKAYDIVLEMQPTFQDYLERKYKEELLSDDYKTRYENFYNVLEMIVELPYKNYDKEEISKLLTSIRGQIAEGKWLRAKLLEV